MQNKKLIIFDMDGTLVDSSEVIVGAINHVRCHLGLPPMDKRTILDAVNDPTIDAPKFFYNAKAFLPKHEALFSNFYTQNHDKLLRLYDAVEPLLKRLKERNKNLAVATNAYRKSTLESLKHLKIDDYFDCVVCYDDVKEGKPHPEMLYMAMSHLGANSRETLFIGDSIRDELAAKRADIDFLKVGWGFSEEKESVDDIASLHNILLQE